MLAIAAGGELAGLLGALRTRETTIEGLRSELAGRRTQRHPGRADVARIRAEMMTFADSWRRVLAEDSVNARPIVAGLLKGRVTFTPQGERKVWEIRGEGTLIGLFSRIIYPLGIRPHGDTSSVTAALLR